MSDIYQHGYCRKVLVKLSLKIDHYLHNVIMLYCVLFDKICILII